MRGVEGRDALGEVQPRDLTSCGEQLLGHRLNQRLARAVDPVGPQNRGVPVEPSAQPDHGRFADVLPQGQECAAVSPT
jgi:hypothetical protein